MANNLIGKRGRVFLAAVALAGTVAQAQLLPREASPSRAPSLVPQQAPLQAPAVAPGGSPMVNNDALAGLGRIVFVDSTADTGEIFDEEPATVEFKFRNIGGGPLRITNIKPSCGCTVPQMDKSVYEPNETGTIRVEFDPKGRQGAVSRTIQVFTDSQETPNTTINVRSFVRPVVLTIPGDVLNFEAVQKGQSATREIRVFGRFPGFEVQRASTSDPAMYDVEVSSVGEVEWAGETLYEHVVRVTLKPDAKPGQHNTSVSIRTNEERRPIFSVPAVSRVMGDLELSPVRMTLGRLAVGDTFEREMRVRSRSATPFEITGATLSNTAINAEFSFEPVDPEVRNEWIVRAKGVAATAAPRFNAVVNLMTDVKDEELTPLTVTGVLRR
jgi:hypothetical protein